MGEGDRPCGAVPRSEEPWLPPWAFRSAAWACALPALGDELPLGVWVICLQRRAGKALHVILIPPVAVRAAVDGYGQSHPSVRGGRAGQQPLPGCGTWAGAVMPTGRPRPGGFGRVQGGCGKSGGCSPPSQAAGQEGASGSRMAEGPRPPVCGVAGEGQAVPCPLGPPQCTAHLL